MSDVKTEVRWQKLTREEVAAAAEAGAVILQPIGTIEQHGPHLPVDVDIFTCETVALRVADAATFPVLVTPPVWWGVSEYWMEFGGTIPLRPEILVDLLSEIITGVSRNGFRRILILNGHAGNSSAMHNVAVRFLRRGVRVAGMNYWSVASDVMREGGRTDDGIIGHAGEVETALQLALRPDEVRHSLIPDNPATRLPLSTFPPPFAGKVIMPPNPIDESPTGVYGLPNSAQSDYGERILAEAVTRLVEFLEHFRALDLPPEIAPESEKPRWTE